MVIFEIFILHFCLYNLPLYYICREHIFIVYAENTIHCSCQQGYTGNGIGINGCVFDEKIAIDPCRNRPCGFRGLCVKKATNSFFCVCNKGFSGDQMKTFYKIK